jgi:hypothetical protein
MYISRTKFISITLLFLLLPFSSNWKLLLFGIRTTGIVEKHKITSPMWNNSDRYSIIRYKTQDQEFLIYGPEDVIYPIGKKIKIIYRKDKPEDYLMLSAAGLLLTNKMIIPMVLLILWVSFYMTVREAYKGRKPVKSSFNFRKILEKKADK